MEEVASKELQEFARSYLPKPIAEATEPKPVEEKKKHIGLALLSYDGKIYLRTMMSILDAIFQCGQAQFGLNIINREGDSMVARGRSFLASQFLENPGMKDCTDLVFVDTDLVFKGADLVRLCSHLVDVVGAAYPYKNDEGNFPLRWLPQGLIEENGLWQVQATTPGFFKISRRALERIVLEKPFLEFKDRDNPEGQRSWMFFDNAARQTGVYDEGYVFCEHWRSVGGTCYLDPDIHLGHMGMREYRAECKTIRGWLNKKSETLEKLYHDHPNIPPLVLVRKAMGENIDVEEEAKKVGESVPDQKLNDHVASTIKQLESLTSGEAA